MHEKHNATKKYIATINLQLYNTLTEASVIELALLYGTTELCKAANLWKTLLLSSLILLKSIPMIKVNKIKFIVSINVTNKNFIYIKMWFDTCVKII
jgi:hypothetical protein